MRQAEHLFAWLYARYGTPGLIPFIVAASVISSGVNVFAVVVCFAWYADLSLVHVLPFLAIAEAAAAIGCLTGVAINWRAVRLALAWSRERTEERAPETWQVAMVGPQAVCRSAVLAISVLQVVPISLAVAHFDRPAYVIALMTVAAAATTATNAIFLMFGIEFAVRPMTQDVAAHLPHGFEPEVSTLSLAAKAMIPIPGMILFTGLLVGAFVDTTADIGPRLATALGLAAATGAIGVPLFVVATRSALGPIDDLTDAIRRIREGDLTKAVPILIADELGALARSFNEMAAGLRQREALRSAMGAYVDETVADRVLAEGQLLRGEAVDVTIMFIDIVGFTTLAEHTSSEDVVSDLNDFFEIVIPAIEAEGGHPNKLLGDGAMAVFGIPNALPNHAEHALAAARSIDERLAERYRGELRVGIGLNSGTVVAGSMGGGAKLDYTVIGDPVNVAARVEALTRQTGDTILLTDATRQALSEPPDDLEARGSTAVKGRSQ
jgi:adenylate cyclase